MTLEELDKLKQAAAHREHLLGCIAKIRTARLYDGVLHPFMADGAMSAFGFDLLPSHVEAMREGLIGDLHHRIAGIETELRAGGVVFPEPAPTLRPPVSWDEASGEFTFVIASTKEERSERGLGYGGMIAVDQVILPRGLLNSRRPMSVTTVGGSRKATVGEVVRIWEEGGQILGRAMLFPEASAARAAVASGAVADVGWMFDVCRERVTPREGLRPLVTVEEWNLEGVVLISDDPNLGKLDPRDECPGKAKAA